MTQTMHYCNLITLYLYAKQFCVSQTHTHTHTHTHHLPVLSSLLVFLCIIDRHRVCVCVCVCGCVCVCVCVCVLLTAVEVRSIGVSIQQRHITGLLSSFSVCTTVYL